MKKLKSISISILVAAALSIFVIACREKTPEETPSAATAPTALSTLPPATTSLTEETVAVETPVPEPTKATEEGGAEPEAPAVGETAAAPTRSGFRAEIVSGDVAGAGKPFTFDATQSQAGDQPIVDYKWDMGDGTTLFGLAIEHDYSEIGLYTVSLTITDEDGQTDTTSKEVEVISLEDLTIPTAVIEFNLVGTSWVMNNAMRGTTVTLIFGEDSLSGSSSCNSYSAGYSIRAWEGNSTDISVGFISSTGQVCSPEIMAQERGFLESLDSARRVTIDESTLILETGSGTLTFRSFESTE